MTAIAAVVHEGKVFMGGDSAGVAGWSLRQRKDSKVFVNGSMVFGFTSSFRMGQILRYAFTPPVMYEGQDLDKYMVTTFIDAVRAAFKTAGYATVSDSVERGGTFLVGFKGRLFEIDGDYQVGFVYEDFNAVGSGDELCLGSLFSTKSAKDMTPERRIRLALSAAEAFVASVRGPFNVVREP